MTDLDPAAPHFKLAPTYTLYLVARYRASTHYRPELTPTERAHRLTVLLARVAAIIHNVIQVCCWKEITKVLPFCYFVSSWLFSFSRPNISDSVPSMFWQSIMFTKADLPCSLYDRSLLPFVITSLDLLVGPHDCNVVSVHCRRGMLMPSHWHSGWQIHLSFFTSWSLTGIFLHFPWMHRTYWQIVCR